MINEQLLKYTRTKVNDKCQANLKLVNVNLLHVLQVSWRESERLGGAYLHNDCTRGS